MTPTALRVRGKDLKAGMIVYLGESKAPFMVVANGPAGTIPGPQALEMVEPSLVELSHVHDDCWVQTHQGTYALFGREEQVEVNESMRVQTPPRRGSFLGHDERLQYLRQGENDG